MPDFVNRKNFQTGFSKMFGAQSQFADNATILQGLANKFTGNLDYARNKALQENAQAFNAEQASIAWEREMQASNTAYQRQTADLAKAGYNPALALGAGGASTPTAYSATSPQASYSGRTAGWDFLANALIAGLGLGIKATATASQVALNEVKGSALGAGSASLVSLNSAKVENMAKRASIEEMYREGILSDKEFYRSLNKIKTEDIINLNQSRIALNDRKRMAALWDEHKGLAQSEYWSEKAQTQHYINEAIRARRRRGNR